MNTMGWSNHLKPLYSINLVTHIPPFVTHPHRPPYIMLLGLAIETFNLFRAIVFGLLIDSPLSEAMTGVVYVAHHIAHVALLGRSRRRFLRYLNEIDEFIEMGCGLDKTKTFSEIWENEKPWRNFIRFVHMYVAAMTVVWHVIPFYYLYVDVDNAQQCVFFWEPFFDSGPFAKWTYSIVDTFMVIYGVSCIYIFDVLYVYTLTYNICLLKYLKERLGVVDKFVDEDFRVWTREHQEVLRLTGELKALFAPNLLISYMYNLTSLVMWLLTILQDTVMTPEQMVIGSLSALGQLVFFGWECRLADNLQDMHETMAQPAYHGNMALHSKWRMSWLKIVTLRTALPMRLKGVAFFTLSSKSFRETVTAAYSLFTTLLRVVKFRGN